MTKTDAAEIDATYNSILKDEEATAVLGKLLPTPTLDGKKGEFFSKDIFLFVFVFFVAFASQFLLFDSLNFLNHEKRN